MIDMRQSILFCQSDRQGAWRPLMLNLDLFSS